MQIKHFSLQSYAFLSLMILLVTGCARYDYEVGVSLEKGEEVLSFYVGYHLVSSSERDEDEFISELLTQELQKKNLCADGYVIDRKERSRHSDYLWFFHCK